MEGDVGVLQNGDGFLPQGLAVGIGEIRVGYAPDRVIVKSADAVFGKVHELVADYKVAGFILGFREPVAEVANTSVMPKLFRAQMLAR